MRPESELPLLTIFGRAVLAALLGFAIGWERRATGSPVRARVIALVAMTSAALTAICIQMTVPDISRVMAGLLTGIGFLGAGVVMRNNSGEVRGLMTAAALWAMTVVAITIGAGFIALGILLAFAVYVVIAWDDWPAATRLHQRRTAKKAKTLGTLEQVAQSPVHHADSHEK